MSRDNRDGADVARPPWSSRLRRALSWLAGERYHVAISVFREDPGAMAVAEELAVQLGRHGLKVFFYRDEREAFDLLGRDLPGRLRDVYGRLAHLVIPVFSPRYASGGYTQLEWDTVQKRVASAGGGFLIAVSVADTEQLPVTLRGFTYERLGRVGGGPEEFEAFRRVERAALRQLTRASFLGGNTSGAHLGNVFAPGTTLFGCDLRGATFFLADLTGVQLLSCKLRGARFTNTYLTGARFEDCDLAEAVFTNPDVKHEGVWGDLAGVRFIGCKMGGVLIAGADCRAGARDFVRSQARTRHSWTPRGQRLSIPGPPAPVRSPRSKYGRA